MRQVLPEECSRIQSVSSMRPGLPAAPRRTPLRTAPAYSPVFAWQAHIARLDGQTPAPEADPLKQSLRIHRTATITPNASVGLAKTVSVKYKYASATVACAHVSSGVTASPEENANVSNGGVRE